MASIKVKFTNAHLFNQKVLEDPQGEEFFRVLLSDFEGPFFSHLHDLALEMIAKEEVILHFHDYFYFLLDEDQGYSLSESYFKYYKELSKQSHGIKEEVWKGLYTFYYLYDRSNELRCIKFALERSSGTDVIAFYIRIRKMISAVLQLDDKRLILDNLHIDPSDVSNLLSAIYDAKSVNKMYLLEVIQSKLERNGINAGEFATILLYDFVNSREKEENERNKHKAKPAMQFAAEGKMKGTKADVWGTPQRHEEEHSKTQEDKLKSPTRFELTSPGKKSKGTPEAGNSKKKELTLQEKKNSNKSAMM